MSSRGPNHDMRGEHVLKVEAELRTNGRTNGCARTDAHERMRTNGLTYERTNELWMKMCLCANERMMEEAERINTPNEWMDE